MHAGTILDPSCGRGVVAVVEVAAGQSKQKEAAKQSSAANMAEYLMHVVLAFLLFPAGTSNCCHKRRKPS